MQATCDWSGVAHSSQANLVQKKVGPMSLHTRFCSVLMEPRRGGASKCTHDIRLSGWHRFGACAS